MSHPVPEPPTTSTLPTLTMTCPHCGTDEAQERINREWGAWNDEETAAYNKFADDYLAEDRYGDAYAAWKHSTEYHEIAGREPDRPWRGCGECDYTGEQLTPEGRQIVELVHRYFKVDLA